MKWQDNKVAARHAMQRSKKTTAWESVRFALVNERGVAREDVMMLENDEALTLLSDRVTGEVA